MSFLVRSFQRKAIFCSLLRVTQARQAHWLPDFMPGPYPTTKEERERAAAKYNLLPEEYEPFPLDEDPVGDYPKLPFVSVDAKDPLYPWDDPELRRDYNEAVNRQIMILLREGLSSDVSQAEVHKESLICVLFLISFGLLAWYGVRWKIVDPSAEKQYPYSGKTYYTFEIEADDADVQNEEKLKACQKDAGVSDISELTKT